MQLTRKHNKFPSHPLWQNADTCDPSPGQESDRRQTLPSFYDFMTALPAYSCELQKKLRGDLDSAYRTHGHKKASDARRGNHLSGAPRCPGPPTSPERSMNIITACINVATITRSTKSWEHQRA